jgi:hypothetical protein
MPELRKLDVKQPVIKRSQLSRINELRQRIYRRTGKILSTVALLGLLLHPSFSRAEDTNFGRRPITVELMQTYLDSNYEAALRKTIDEFKKYIYDRSEGSHNRQILFGPNLDDAYQYRIGDKYYNNYSDVGLDVWGDTNPDKKKIGLRSGLPDLELLPKELLNLLKLLNVATRLEFALNSDKIYVVKHFPGANDVEITEDTSHFVKGSLKLAKETFMIPFELLFKKTKPKAVMISHSTFEFERELRQKYPEFEKYYFSNDSFPASLSPAIIRGLLRKEFGFKGLIFSDWYNMGAIDEFIKKAPSNKVIAGANINTKLFYFAILAGVNVFKGAFPNLEQLEKNI